VTPVKLLFNLKAQSHRCLRRSKRPGRPSDVVIFRFDRAEIEATTETVQATPQELKKTLTAMVAKLSPLDPLVKEAVADVVSKEGSASLSVAEVKETVEKAVKGCPRASPAEVERIG
jgi:hypothetical protein